MHDQTLEVEVAPMTKQRSGPSLSAEDCAPLQKQMPVYWRSRLNKHQITQGLLSFRVHRWCVERVLATLGPLSFFASADPWSRAFVRLSIQMLAASDRVGLGLERAWLSALSCFSRASCRDSSRSSANRFFNSSVACILAAFSSSSACSRTSLAVPPLRAGRLWCGIPVGIACYPGARQCSLSVTLSQHLLQQSTNVLRCTFPTAGSFPPNNSSAAAGALERGCYFQLPA